jgi:hypothetical protein
LFGVPFLGTQAVSGALAISVWFGAENRARLPGSLRLVQAAQEGRKMIDWISLSTPDPALGMRWYKKLVEEELRGIFLRRHFGSSVISFTGKFWSAIEENRGLARVHGLRLHGFAVTRVDFAWDTMGALMEEARLFLKGAVTIIISPTGTTLYSGSRESARFLRVYDKTSEIKAKTGVDLDFALTRVELETRREICREYLAVYERCESAKITADVVDRYGLAFLSANPGQRICVAREDAGCPLEFVQRFYRVIGKALVANPDMFIEALELKGKATIAITSSPATT